MRNNCLRRLHSLNCHQDWEGGHEDEWNEIERDFIETDFFKKDQIIIMPCGENQKELEVTRPIAAEMAIKHGVRFCDRLHVTIWDKKTGV